VVIIVVVLGALVGSSMVGSCIGVCGVGGGET
jgi:hypothetical protein